MLVVPQIFYKLLLSGWFKSVVPLKGFPPASYTVVTKIIKPCLRGFSCLVELSIKINNYFRKDILLTNYILCTWSNNLHISWRIWNEIKVLEAKNFSIFGSVRGSVHFVNLYRLCCTLKDWKCSSLTYPGLPGCASWHHVGVQAILLTGVMRRLRVPPLDTEW